MKKPNGTAPEVQGMAKKYVTVDLYEENRSVTGRFLGMIDDKEFATILNNRKLQNKLFSAESKPIADIETMDTDIDGLRILIAVRKIDDKDTLRKTLFISEPLEMVGHAATTNQENPQIGVCAVHKSCYIMIEEKGD